MHARSLRTALLGVAAAFGFMTIAPAQAEAQFQVQANYNLDAERFGFGGGYNFNLGGLTANNGITAVATFDYYLKKFDTTMWDANVNGKMDIKSVAGLYVGAGAGISKVSYSSSYCDLWPGICDAASSSDFHLNALAGWNFASSKKGPFVEGGFTLGDGSALRVGGGIRF